MTDPRAIAARLEAEARTAGPEIVADLVVRLGGDLRGRHATLPDDAGKTRWDEDGHAAGIDAGSTPDQTGRSEWYYEVRRRARGALSRNRRAR